MKAIIPGILMLLIVGCDVSERDRLEHEYSMECLQQHGQQDYWTQLCRLPDPVKMARR